MKRITQAEIDEMWRNGYDPQTIAEAEFSVERTALAAQVCEQIRTAFAGVTLGTGIGLYQTCAIDDYGTHEQISAASAKDEKQDWSRLTAEVILKSGGSLSFTDAQGFRFLVPAFMIADLEGDDYSLGAVFHLTFEFNQPWRLERFGLLNPEQRKAVCAYLEFSLEDPYLRDQRAIERALENYWRLENPPRAPLEPDPSQSARHRSPRPAKQTYDRGNWKRDRDE